MAEQEIIKHTEKAIKALGNKNVSFWHKAKDALYEIAIIVFAITLSIWFHNWSEHRKEQKEVKAFLLGLKKDIEADITDTKNTIGEYDKAGKVFTYVSNANANHFPSNDSVKIIGAALNTYFTIRPHQTRFNGFLSSGKITNIENDSLQFNILNYYQETFPSYHLSEEEWIKQHTNLINYLKDNTKDWGNMHEGWLLLTSPKGHYLSEALVPWQQLKERMNNIVNEGTSIIKQIDALYPNEK